jgi:cell division protein ZapA
MDDKTISTTVTLLGKPYPIRCPEAELHSLQKAADYLNQKMTEVQESGKAINVERIAIITALNITYQLLQGDQQKTSLMDKINQHLLRLQDKLDGAINQSVATTELIYSAE